MRVSTLAVAAAVASIVSPTGTSAFVQRRPNPSILRQRHAAPLSMVSTESTRSSSSAAAEEELQHHVEVEAVMSGTVLEDGPVMDFGSLKASSRAEVALSTAREQYLANREAATAAGDHTVTSNLMGINEEVVETVGHELGTYCTAQEVQDCAAWLRNGKPQQTTNTAEQWNEETLLEKAYVESGEVTEAFAKTFYLATSLLPTAARRAIWAVYVWCRRTDEIVDAPRAEGDTDMLIDLAAWEHRLHQLWDPAQGNQVVDVLDLPLLDVHLTYPDLDIQPFLDMIRGMLMDIDGLDNIGQERYQTFDELHLYCYRVAGTVGLMSMPIFKTAPGFTELQAKYVSFIV
jgi:phytoene synthase